MFDQHRGFLEEWVDPDFGLLDKLLASRSLSRIECEDIKDQHPFYRRNARLLDYISQKEKYDSLISALRDTRQTHLVNYLIGNGEHKSEYGGDWPLTEKELLVLDTNQESLVDLVECSDLLVRLYSAHVINGRQRETISSEPTNHRRNEVLLNILRKRSIDDYRQVVRCLHESNQSHVAKILEEGGVVVRVHADLGSGRAADDAEDDIITRFTDVLSGRSVDEASRILNKMTEIGLTVIAAKKGQSVVLYIYCRTESELTDLYRMNLSGILRNTIEWLFSQLLLCSTTTEYAEVTVENLKDVIESALTRLYYRSQTKHLAVSLPTKEYKRGRSFFSDDLHIVRAVSDSAMRRRDDLISFRKGDIMITTADPENKNIGEGDWWKVEHLGNGAIGYIPRNRVVIDYSQEMQKPSRNLGLPKRSTTSRMTAASSTTINFLPLELLDIILQKSYLHYALNKGRLKNQSDRFLITQLATVNHCWFQRMRKHRFKRIVWRRLLFAFNKVHREIVILRSNQSFLAENMHLREGLLDKLRLSDCLTDVQTRILKRQTVVIGKNKLIIRNNNSELLHVLLSCDDTRRSDCFRCFPHSKQKLFTKVMDNGGVVLKMNLCGKDAEKSQQLSERLNDLHDKTKLRPDTMEIAMSRLIDSGIEIFHSQMDRQAALFIWCKSQMGHENLRKLLESKSIVDVICDLTTSSASESDGSRIIDADIDQFKKTVVVCPIVVRFMDRLVVNNHEKVMGVTVLRQEICVLCRIYSSSLHAIRVFQNRNPFRLNAKIDIGNFAKQPKDIGSSDEENCFFVLDSEKECVWKILRQKGKHHKFISLQSAHFQGAASTLSVSCYGQQLLILTRSSLVVYRGFRVERNAKEISLLTLGIEDPCHAVETSSGHFIVLHSLAGSEKEGWKQRFSVSKVTRDGRMVVSRFVPQNETQELNNSCYLALDSDDRVFVADSGSDRVVLLDSDLSWIRVLCPTEDDDLISSSQHRLCYDKAEKQLIVAGYLMLEGANVYSIDKK